MKFVLKKIIMTDFKGFRNKELEFGKKTKISGQNGCGKSSIFTAFTWLLLDKDAELNSNPPVLPDDGRECNPTVTAICDIDGKEVTLTKMQKCKKSKPDENGISKVSLINTYLINEVPKTERDFRSYLEELGVNFDRLLFCIHPLAFLRQKTADMRKMLFSMASEKSDLDIAKMSAETADVAELLKSYKYEEIEAMQKASKKKADEQVKSIPEQIKGMELSKVDVDTAEQELAKNELERKIAEIDTKIKTADSGIDDLLSRSMQLQLDLSGIMQSMNREITDAKSRIRHRIMDCTGNNNDFQIQISNAERIISSNKEKISTADKKRKELGELYKEERVKGFDNTICFFNEADWQFDETTTVCSLCGQRLPEDKIETLKSEFEQKKQSAKNAALLILKETKNKFEKEKEEKVEQILQSGFTQKKIIEDCTAENLELEKNIATWKSESEKALQEQSGLEKQLAALPAEADYSTNAEYVKLKAEYDQIQTKIASLKDSSSIKESLVNERNTLATELDKVKEIIAQASNNIRIDEQISALHEKQMDYEQAKADAEKILYQLSLVSKKKNEVLSEEINSRFGIVKWVLFDYMKNGNYAEVCIPTVDGFRFGESTNTGREIIAKLDICNSFQKFYGTEYPLFFDGAESLNDFNLPKLECQLITLNVTEGCEMQVEVE